MKTNKLIYCIVLFFLLISCNKDDDSNPLQGDIVGFVQLYDENNYDLSDNSGVTVTIDTLNKSTTTDENGRYYFSDIGAGTYCLTFSKDGYFSKNLCGCQFIGGNVPYYIGKSSIYEKPDIEVDNFEATYSNDLINVTATINETSQYWGNIYFSTDAEVSNENYEYAQQLYFCCTSTTSIDEEIALGDTPFTENETIYLVIYFRNYYGSISFAKYTDIISLVLN